MHKEALNPLFQVASRHHVGRVWTGNQTENAVMSAGCPISSSFRRPVDKMAEFNVFSAVFLGAIAAFIGVITFLVYKLRILHKYIYKVGKFSVIFVGKNLKFCPRKITKWKESFFNRCIDHMTIILQYTFFLETSKKSVKA